MACARTCKEARPISALADLVLASQRSAVLMTLEMASVVECVEVAYALRFSSGCEKPIHVLDTIPSHARDKASSSQVPLGVRLYHAVELSIAISGKSARPCRRLHGLREAASQTPSRLCARRVAARRRPEGVLNGVTAPLQNRCRLTSMAVQISFPARQVRKVLMARARTIKKVR